MVDVFRSKNNSYNADRFYTNFTTTENDLDPTAQTFMRRVLQIRRTSCKKSGAEKRYKDTLIKYAIRHKTAGAWPPWYRDDQDSRGEQDLPFPI